MSRSSSLRALPASDLGIVRFPTVRIGDGEGMARVAPTINGCHHTGRLRRTASPWSFALPVASLQAEEFRTKLEYPGSSIASKCAAHSLTKTPGDPRPFGVTSTHYAQVDWSSIVVTYTLRTHRFGWMLHHSRSVPRTDLSRRSNVGPTINYSMNSSARTRFCQYRSRKAE